MTWKVIIADDEHFIRQRIKKIIPWADLDLEFSGEAENGQEVLSLFSKEAPHILLLDIKMPKLTGMDVAKHIHQHYPQTKTIILSGYNDFEYARLAMRYSVVDYLLKPIHVDDLKATLLTCIDKLEEERIQAGQHEKLMSYEKTLALSQVLNGSLSFEQLKNRYPDFSSFSCCLYVGAYFNENGHLLLHELSGLLRKKNIFHVTFQDSDTQYLIQIFQKSPEDCAGFTLLLQKFLYRHNLSFLYLGSPFPVTEPWKPFYKTISHGILLRYFFKLPLVLEERSGTYVSASDMDFHAIRQTVIHAFNNQDEEAFKDYIQVLFETLKPSNNTRHLYLTLSELFLTYALYMEDFQSSSEIVSGLVASVLDEEFSLEALAQTVVTYGLSCLRHDKASPFEIMVSKKIIAYIQQHYQESELSVAQLAHLFQMNVSYMGYLFKKVNNQSILQYITSMRMEHAKKLLEGNQFRVFEVAKLVGYGDEFYFSRRFKKSYGCSPKEYARSAPRQNKPLSNSGL